MLNFDFLEKGLEVVSLPYFVNDFSSEMFNVLYPIIDQISMHGCLFFLRYW